ncbi:hypothetical protein FDF08_04205 [Micrococcus luteus]|nr:hypothetical protein FDF08_04205 [Micrococcus luteus]
MALFRKTAAWGATAAGAVALAAAAMAATWTGPGYTVVNDHSNIFDYKGSIKTTSCVRQSDGTHLIGGYIRYVQGGRDTGRLWTPTATSCGQTVSRSTTFKDSLALNAPKTQFYYGLNKAPYGALSEPLGGN